MLQYDKNGIVKPQNSEPTHSETIKYMEQHTENYYNSREQLRELAYGGKPPQGYSSWGDYWKSI